MRAVLTLVSLADVGALGAHCAIAVWATTMSGQGACVQ